MCVSISRLYEMRQSSEIERDGVWIGLRLNVKEFCGF